MLAALNAHGWAIPDDGVFSDVSLGGPARSAAAAAYGHLLLLGPAKPGYFDTASQMPGALIEPLFITDPFEGSIAASSAGQHAIAAGLARAADRVLCAAHTRSSNQMTSHLGRWPRCSTRQELRWGQNSDRQG